MKWNAEAEVAGARHRVFCASMADVFEKRRDLDVPRERLWELIGATPSLDWLLLTKRPENISGMIGWSKDEWPHNIWLGTTVENHRYAEKRLPHLLVHPATVRFLSCEPLLGHVDLQPWFRRRGLWPIDWVIGGGESGGRSRPMHPRWPASLARQCRAAGVPFHFKQWGNWTPVVGPGAGAKGELVYVRDEQPARMVRTAKKAAGRSLLGRIWNGLPRPSLPSLPAHADRPG